MDESTNNNGATAMVVIKEEDEQNAGENNNNNNGVNAVPNEQSTDNADANNTARGNDDKEGQ